MQHYIESEVAMRVAHQPVRDVEMRGRRNGDELGQALHQAQYGGLPVIDFHEVMNRR